MGSIEGTSAASSTTTQDMSAGTDYSILHRQSAETSEVPESGLEESQYEAHGYKDQELRDFRAQHEGEFMIQESRSYPTEKFGDPDGVVRSINPLYDATPNFSNNCADCARSTERTWRGNHEEAAGRLQNFEANGELVPLGEWSAETEEWAGENFTPAPSDVDLRQALLDGGHGSSAIVHSSWDETADSSGGGHAYNLVNYNDDVRVLDGQTGQNLDWAPGDIHPAIGPNPTHDAMAWNARGECIW